MAASLAIRRLALKLHGVSPALARHLALALARELAAVAPGAAGLEPRLRVQAHVTAPELLSRRIATALVRPHRAGPH